MSVARPQPPSTEWRTGNATSAHLLLELRNAHQNLLAAMAAMDNLTREPQTDRARYAKARWRISQASLARRTLWGTIFRHLMPRVSSEEVVHLEHLRTADQQMLRHSANHIAIWILARIEADWKGYCEASIAIRWRMKCCLDAEQRILYPMLESSSASS